MNIVLTVLNGGWKPPHPNRRTPELLRQNTISNPAIQTLALIAILFSELNERLRIKRVGRRNAGRPEFGNDGVSFRIYRFHNVQRTVAKFFLIGFSAVGKENGRNGVDKKDVEWWVAKVFVGLFRFFSEGIMRLPIRVWTPSLVDIFTAPFLSICVTEALVINDSLFKFALIFRIKVGPLKGR